MTYSFKKTSIQIKATKLMASSPKHIMCYGGSRSGKTFNIVRCIIARASKCKSRHIILRLTFNACKTSIFMDTFPKVMSICYPNLSYSVNKSDYCVTLPNGSEIWFGGLDDDKRVEKHLGKEYSTIFFNECSQLSYSSIQIMLTRLAEKSDLKKKVYYDENPPSKKHWSYWLFVKKLDPVESEPLDDPDNYASIVMNPKDNLDNIDPDYLKMLSKMPEKERMRFLEGEFTNDDDGAAYYAFDREIHVSDTDMIKAGSIFIGMDFNVQPMTAVILRIAGGKFYITDEIYLENSDTYKMCDTLVKKKYFGTVIPDSTGKNRKTSGKSDHAILKEHGFTIPVVRNPFVTDRVNNVNRLLTDNRIIINPKCKKLIGDLEKVSWKDNKLDQKTDPMLTHISDALGYALWYLEPITGNRQASTIGRYR
jgi:PBSX family phage terminase large subunit